MTTRENATLRDLIELTNRVHTLLEDQQTRFDTKLDDTLTRIDRRATEVTTAVAVKLDVQDNKLAAHIKESESRFARIEKSIITLIVVVTLVFLSRFCAVPLITAFV